MARSDAVQFFLELAAEWRRLGAEVTFEPGWERRGNGTSPAYEGGIVHHTGFVSSMDNPLPARNTLLNGRPDLSGPLCNVAGPVCPVDKPRLHVVAAFPANHAGASGGRSMGPLPKSSLFNRLVVGLEIDYAGLTPMLGGQRLAALIFTRGLANVLARSVEYIRAHAETSITGKWDIGVGDGAAHTADMAAFRRDAAAFTPGAIPAAEPEEEEDMGLIVGVAGGGIWVRDGAGYDYIGEPATVNQLEIKGEYKVISISAGEHENWVKQQKARAAAVDSKAIADAVAAAVGQALAHMPAPALDPAALAKAIEDERDHRARDNNAATGPVS